MTSKENTRFPASALKRYADLVLRHVHQGGGQERYVPVRSIEEGLGLEPHLILQLCRTRLLGEIQIAWRLTDELEQSTELQTPVERQLVRNWFSEPHLRIRPDHVRLTPEELLRPAKKRRKKNKKRRKSRS